MEAKHTAEKHFIPFSVYVLIWLGLVSLTVLTVSVAGVDLHRLALFVALTIAAIKSVLVVLYFMHIRFDDLIFKVFLLVALLTLASIFILTSFDIFYR